MVLRGSEKRAAVPWREQPGGDNQASKEHSWTLVFLKPTWFLNLFLNQQHASRMSPSLSACGWSMQVLYKQWMKLISTEKAAVSGMKHGSFLIMHSSSTEHFRTGREGDGTWLQI